MDLLSISDSKCRRCYRCVRECPTNALKIDQGKVKRITNRCIFCGVCYKHCPQDAVNAHTGARHVLELLDSGEKVVILLDPTFPAVLDKGTPHQLVAALKKLGFAEVWESAVGGELVTRAYHSWLLRNQETPWISSFCPSLVYYIEKFVPRLAEQLVPIVSPMAACGMAVKRLRGPDTKVVFVGSCISRIRERMTRSVKPYVDDVLIYHDVTNMLKLKGIDREQQEPSDFDGPRSGPGRILGIAGGMSKCVGFDQDLLNLDYVVEAGPEEAMRALKQFQEGKIRSRFLDLLFCKGCINGPVVDKNIAGPSRKQIIVDYIRSEDGPEESGGLDGFAGLSETDLNRGFSAPDVDLPEPKEEEIQAVLVQLGKTYPRPEPGLRRLRVQFVPGEGEGRRPGPGRDGDVPPLPSETAPGPLFAVGEVSRATEDLSRRAGARPTAADPNRKDGLPGSAGGRRCPRAEQPHRVDHDVQPDPAERTGRERTVAKGHHPRRPGSRPGGQDRQGPPQLLQGNQDQAGPSEHQHRDRRGLVAPGQAVSLSQYPSPMAAWPRPFRRPSPTRISSNRSF